MIFDKSIFKKLLFWLFNLLLVFTPLIHGNFTTEYFELPKMFFVYFLGSLTVFVFAIGVILGKLKFKMPPALVILFLITQVVATVFSRYPYTAVWGYYSRLSGGLASTLIYIALFEVAYSVFLPQEILKGVATGILLSGIPVSILGIFQYVGLDPGFGKIERVYSTFGQPNWLAIFLVWFVILSMHKFLENPKTAIKNSWVWWLDLFNVGFTCLWFTFSLSGFLALVFGIATLIILNKSHYSLKKAFLLAIIPLSLVIFAPGMFLLRIKDGWTDFGNQFSFLHPLFQDSLTTDSSIRRAPATLEAIPKHQISDPGFIRFALWEGSLKIPFQNPKNFLIGIGPEAFPYVFPFFRPKELNYSSEWDFIFNKPHNYFIELFVETGFFSLLLYLGIVFKALWKRHPWGTGILVASLVSNFFGWPSVVADMYFWVLLAGILKYEK